MRLHVSPFWEEGKQDDFNIRYISFQVASREKNWFSFLFTICKQIMSYFILMLHVVYYFRGDIYTFRQEGRYLYFMTRREIFILFDTKGDIYTFQHEG